MEEKRENLRWKKLRSDCKEIPGPSIFYSFDAIKLSTCPAILGVERICLSACNLDQPCRIARINGPQANNMALKRWYNVNSIGEQ